MAPTPAGAAGAAYALSLVQELVRGGHYVPTGAALCGMGELGFDRTDIEACIATLTAVDFHKSDPSDQRPGTFLDIYKPTYCGHRLYVKVQIVQDPRLGELVVIVSFKRK